MRSIADILAQPDPDQQVRWLEQDGQTWRNFSAPELIRRAWQSGGFLVEHGLKPGDAVAIAVSEPIEALTAFLGAIAVGMTPVVLPSSASFRSLSDYFLRVSTSCQSSKARAIMASPDQSAHLEHMEFAELPIIDLTDISGAEPPAFAPTPSARYLQLSSGTSGPNKTIPIPLETLDAQVAALARRLGWTKAKATSFWLPAYHDMGLVGGMLGPLMIGCDLTLMAPAQFVRRPLRFLETLGSGGAQLTAMPPFGLQLILRHLKRRTARVDLDTVSGIIIGAEPIPPEVLSEADAVLSGYGLPPGRLLPAYGLAEAVLAVTLTAPGQSLKVLKSPSKGTSLVGCGPVVPGAALRIVDENGRCVSYGNLGQIQISGPILAAETDNHGWFATGDAGILQDGVLYPVGRMGDAVKIRGVFVFAEELEHLLRTRALRNTQFTVALGNVERRIHVIIVTWGTETETLSDALRILKGETENGHVHHMVLRPADVPRTTSGKIKRAAIWRSFLDRHMSDPVDTPSAQD
ncbi:MAG: AMP-binding protein [Paracoccaceae bacterium]|nr:AMP-binding protein [Paracoccaceae bacterium]